MGDQQWEASTTASILAALKHKKRDTKMTSAELVARFNALTAPETLSKNTLNGILQGKRKSFSVGEVLVFAKIFNCAPSDFEHDLASGDYVASIRKALIDDLLTWVVTRNQEAAYAAMGADPDERRERDAERKRITQRRS